MQLAAAADYTPGLLDRCISCDVVLPNDGPRVCPKCSRVRITPRFPEWPMHLRGYLIMQAAARLFASGESRQSGWERLLTAVFKGETRGGKTYKWAINSDDCYQAAVKEADEWLAAGKPIPFL